MASLDTSCVIDLTGRSGRKLEAAALDAVEDVKMTGELITVSRFALAELQVGVERSEKPAEEAQKVRKLTRSYRVLEFDEDGMEFYGWLKALLQRGGTPIGDWTPSSPPPASPMTSRSSPAIRGTSPSCRGCGS